VFGGRCGDQASVKRVPVIRRCARQLADRAHRGVSDGVIVA